MKNSKHQFYEFQSTIFDERTAELLFQKLKSLSNRKTEAINIALSGGNTPMPILKLLKQKNLNWERFKFFMVDERCVPLDHIQSNYGNLKINFYNEMAASHFSMVQEGLTYEASLKNYLKLLNNLVPQSTNGFPEFDLILLGIGDDGHTASLFPNTKGLTENNKWVILNYIPQLETDRMTLTYPIILSAKEIIIIVKGASKKKILNEIYTHESTHYPMQKIVDESENIIWITD